jgi:hypothetical protein
MPQALCHEALGKPSNVPAQVGAAGGVAADGMTAADAVEVPAVVAAQTAARATAKVKIDTVRK